MALHHALPAEPVDVRPLGERWPQARSATLIKTDRFQLFRLVLRRGETLSEHKVPGPMLFQCIEGELTFHALGRSLVMRAGDLIHLEAGARHALDATQHCSALVTVLAAEPTATKESA